MSKSTPISQLPNNTLPGSSGDMMMDNDPTVQEVLSELAQGQGDTGSMQGQYIPQMPPQQMYNGSPNMAHPQEFIIPQPYNGYRPNGAFGAFQGQPPSKLGAEFDMKQLVLVIAIVAFVQLVPVEQFVFKYIAIENVPYSSVIIKSIFAGGLFVLGKRYLL